MISLTNIDLVGWRAAGQHREGGAKAQGNSTWTLRSRHERGKFSLIPDRTKLFHVTLIPDLCAVLYKTLKLVLVLTSTSNAS